FSESDNLFKCPCHTSSFKLDGGRVHGDAEVAPRDMDQLAVDLRPIVGPEGAKAAEIWIKFVEFQTGTKQRMAAS
ncbi:MAG: hypothetical protein IT424_11815, partial [Pirellulales bacterium]|nr:hypothetical protein [Pirellulales bacterium]